MLDFERVEQLRERGQIEVAPLAFMRGRTLNDSLRDPRRGAERDQRADADVPDAPRLRLEGRGHRRRDADRPAAGRAQRPARGARRCSTGIDGIAFCAFTDADVVRHPLVQKIIVAYEERDERRRDARDATRARREPSTRPRARDAGRRRRRADASRREPEADAAPSRSTALAQRCSRLRAAAAARGDASCARPHPLVAASCGAAGVRGRARAGRACGIDGRELLRAVRRTSSRALEARLVLLGRPARSGSRARR